MARRVFVKDLQADMEIKTAGVEFGVSHNDGSHKGDLYVTKVGLTWCPGKTSKANGKRMNWHDFAEYMENLDS
jgi:hypothetical protein